MKYFDAHAHIQFPPYDEDRNEVIERMKAEEVGGILVGVDSYSSRKAIELSRTEDFLWAAVGLHPNHSDQLFGSEFEEWANDPKVVAIGECGLDYYRPDEPEEVKERQKELFLKHVELAVKVDKPLIIHARPSKGTMDAYRDLIDLLSQKKSEHGDRLRGDIHFFVGGVAEAEALVHLGFTLSFTAVVTFARDYDAVIQTVPLTHILSETDAPYVAPASRRGQRNDPLAVQEVVAKLAEIRGEDPEEVRKTLLQNASRVFSLSLPA